MRCSIDYAELRLRYASRFVTLRAIIDYAYYY